MFLITLFLIVSVGLVAGSFISALSYRYPRKISIAKGRSKCPNCKNIITWYDNIPLFSYLFLSGKCRNCKKRISVRYPFIEFFTMVGFVLIFLEFGQDIVSTIYFLLVYCLLVLVFTVDFEFQIIPDAFVYFGIFLSFAYLLFFNPQSLFPSLFAGFLASFFLLSLFFVTKGRGMGLGDVKFAIFGGMLTGIKLLYIWLFLAFLTGAIVGIILILGQKASLKSKVAFGPFLAFGLFVSILCGEKIIMLLL